eukprot:11596589-Ditylum_brightwellii.AAC.1
MIFRNLKAFLINGPGWALIDAFVSTEDGCAAFQAWANHYNSKGELNKHIALAKAKLKGLFYKNESSMSFEHYSEQLA